MTISALSQPDPPVYSWDKSTPEPVPCTLESSPGEILGYTYLLACADNSLYTGWTNNLEQRLDAHHAGLASKYTRCRLPVKLVGYWAFYTANEARKWEYRLKQWSRAQKMKWLATTNPTLAPLPAPTPSYQKSHPTQDHD